MKLIFKSEHADSEIIYTYVLLYSGLLLSLLFIFTPVIINFSESIGLSIFTGWSESIAFVLLYSFVSIGFILLIVLVRRNIVLPENDFANTVKCIFREGDHLTIENYGFHGYWKRKYKFNINELEFEPFYVDRENDTVVIKILLPKDGKQLLLLDKYNAFKKHVLNSVSQSKSNLVI